MSDAGPPPSIDPTDLAWRLFPHAGSPFWNRWDIDMLVLRRLRIPGKAIIQSGVFNDYGLEVMIWVDNQGQTPGGSEIGTADLASTEYTVYESGSTYSFVMENNETSGTVNIEDALEWLVSNGYTDSSSYMTQFNFGWEICSTDGQSDTFTINNLSLSQNFS
jgi:hypothetical protein